MQLLCVENYLLICKCMHAQIFLFAKGSMNHPEHLLGMEVQLQLLWTICVLKLGGCVS